MANKVVLSPQTIVDKEFDVDFKGYNPEQVDKFFDQVIQDYITYDRIVADLNQKLQDLEKMNASLRAKLVDVEGRVRAQGESTVFSTSGTANVDILKRLSRLEEQVFKDNQR